MNYWILKSEPNAYSWSQFEKDQTTAWTGVRNFAARKNLRAMSIGDLCLFYHSGDEKQIVGLAKVIKPAYRDPTAPDEDWSCVNIAVVKKLAKPITLKQIKADESLENIAFVRQGRLSVSHLSLNDYEKIVQL